MRVETRFHLPHKLQKFYCLSAATNVGVRRVYFFLTLIFQYIQPFVDKLQVHSQHPVLAHLHTLMLCSAVIVTSFKATGT